MRLSPEVGARRASDNTARTCAGVLASPEHLYPVDEDIVDAFRVLMWLSIGRRVADSGRIEDDHVSKVSRRQPPTPIQPQILRR